MRGRTAPIHRPPYLGKPRAGPRGMTARRPVRRLRRSSSLSGAVPPDPVLTPEIELTDDDGTTFLMDDNGTTYLTDD